MNLYQAETIKNQILAVLKMWGMNDDVAHTTASVMVEADLGGIDSHGISMLPGYQRLIDLNQLSVDGVISVIRQNRGTAVIDGGNNLGHSTMVAAMKLASSKAAEYGVGAVTVRRSHHFGAAGYYAKLAADRGQIGLVTSTTRTRAVVPTRGARPLLGTNPLAFAAPSSDLDAPFVLDMSTSTVAVNKVKVYDYLDKDLPAGWVLDENGEPVTDSSDAYHRLRGQKSGGLSPLGGSEALSSHKGYGLAVMVQILAGALAGATFAPLKSPAENDDIGHFCLAIDPGAFGDPGDFERSVSQILSTLREEPSAEPERPILVAGDLERQVRAERLNTGIPISSALVDQIRQICAQGGIPLLL